MYKTDIKQFQQKSYPKKFQKLECKSGVSICHTTVSMHDDLLRFLPYEKARDPSAFPTSEELPPILEQIESRLIDSSKDYKH